MNRNRTPLSALDDWGDAEADEEETVHIDECRDLPQQASNSALLNSMPVQKSRVPTSTPKIVEDVPNVFLDVHYHRLNNEYMRYRWQSDEEEDDSSSSSSSDDEEVAETDLFESLVMPPQTTKKRTNAAVASDKELRPKKRQKTKEFDSLRRPECFLCAWGNKFHDGIKAKHANRLLEIVDEYYGKSSNIELAGMLHLYFKKKVYKPEDGMTMLTKQVVLDHIEGLHSLSASIFVGESIRKWKKIFFGLENALFKENGKYDDKTIDKLEKAQKMINMLYKMKIEELNFSHGKTSDDTRRIAQPFNLMHELKQKTAQRKQIKKKKQLATMTQLLPSQGFDT